MKTDEDGTVSDIPKQSPKPLALVKQSKIGSRASKIITDLKKLKKNKESR